MAALKQSSIGFYLVFLLLVVLSFLILKPFLVAILYAWVLAFLFYPLYQKLTKDLVHKRIAAAITAFVIVVAVTAPFIFIGNSILEETTPVVETIKEVGIKKFTCAENKVLCDKLPPFFQDEKILDYLTNSLFFVSNLFTESITSLVKSLPKLIINFFIIIFVVYYSFLDGHKLIKKIQTQFNIPKNDLKKFLDRITEIMYGTIYAYIFVGIIQGIVAGIGYWIFGIKSFILLAVITMITSIIPYVGSYWVWLPVALFKIINGSLANNSAEVNLGIGLLVYSALLVASVDNILRPIIIGDRAKLHPVMVLFGVLGGIGFFGLIGVLIGPVILGVTLTFLEIYRSRLFAIK